MVDHFLESVDHKKNENIGLVHLGKKVRELEVNITLGTYNFENV